MKLVNPLIVCLQVLYKLLLTSMLTCSDTKSTKDGESIMADHLHDCFSCFKGVSSLNFDILHHLFMMDNFSCLRGGQ